MRLLYTLLVMLLACFFLPYLTWRGMKQRDYRGRWRERLGFAPIREQPIAVWVHAVSVGEVQAAAPLIEALIARHGERHILVTTVTPTGSAQARARFGERVQHSYLPYDLPLAIWRFLGRVQPRQVVIIETELWPHLYRALARRGIPLIVANARLSARSLKGYARVRSFAAEVLADATHIAAQSDMDAQRFRTLGASRVSVMGNLKFDLTLPPTQPAPARSRPVWIAASTHEGEEAAALAAHRAVLAQVPQALLILVPRHPQRFDAVAKLLEKSGLRFARRSALSGFPDEPGTAPCEVLLGDSMGEMFSYYAAADVALVGGSLAPIGGHNVLEPAALALPVLFGPHMDNFLAARDLLIEAGAAQAVSADALAGTVQALFADPARRAAMGAAGRMAVEANRGALARLMQRLEAPTASSSAMIK